MKSNIIDIVLEETGTEPVTLAEVKAQLIITFSDDDAFLTALIPAARAAIENFCNISLIDKDVTLTVDSGSRFELPYGPVKEVTTVEVEKEITDNAPVYEAAQGWSVSGIQFKQFTASNFTADITVNSRYGYPNQGYGTPYRITYTTGYDPVPADLKKAILIQAAWLYENRGDQSKEGLNPEAEGLAMKYRRLSWL